MKKIAIVGLLVVFGMVSGALAGTETSVDISTQGYTEFVEKIITDFTTIFEFVTFEPGNGAPSFELHKRTSVFDGDPYTGEDSEPGPGPYGTYLYEYKTVDASDGTTTFAECAVGGGFEGAAGYIGEFIRNTDTISINKTVYNFGEWHLWEHKEVSGSGETTIYKELATWGKTPNHWTDAEAYVYFEDTSGYGYGWEDYYTEGGALVGTLPSYEVALGWCRNPEIDPDIPFDRFESAFVTDEPFEYFEDAAINPGWPDLGE